MSPRRFLALPFPTRAAVAVWALLLVGVAVRVAVARPVCQSVVPIYTAAGERWLAGEPVYGPVPGLDLFRNPPAVAAAFTPLSLLPPKAGALMWRGASAAVFLIGLVRFRRAIAPDFSPARAAWVFVGAAVLVLPGLNNGQVNVLLAGAGLNAAAAIALTRWRAAAGWLGLAAGLKVYPLALGLLFTAAAPRKLGGRLAVAVGLAAAAPFLTQSPHYVRDRYVEFASYLGSDDRTDATPERAPRDWTIVPRTWLGVVPPAAATKAVGAVAGLFVAAFVVLTRKRSDAAGLTLVAGTAWMTAFGPATEANTYVLFAGAANWLALAPGGPVWSRRLAFAGTSLLVLAVVRGVLPGDGHFNGLGPQPLGALMLLAAAAGRGMTREAAGVPAVVLTARVRGVRVPGPAVTSSAAAAS